MTTTATKATEATKGGRASTFGRFGRIAQPLWPDVSCPMCEGKGLLAADPVENPSEDTARRAHACEAALRRLEGRLGELGPHLPFADCRLLARVMHDALREKVDG